MIIELLGLLKTFRIQNIALNMRKTVKKKERCLNVAQQAKKNAQILLKTQESADECWKCKIVLQKVPKKSPAQSGHA